MQKGCQSNKEIKNFSEKPSNTFFIIPNNIDCQNVLVYNVLDWSALLCQRPSFTNIINSTGFPGVLLGGLGLEPSARRLILKVA